MHDELCQKLETISYAYTSRSGDFQVCGQQPTTLSLVHAVVITRLLASIKRR